MASEGFLMGPRYGPSGILVRSVLWPPFLYMACNGYVLGSKLGAHRKTVGLGLVFEAGYS